MKVIRNVKFIIKENHPDFNYIKQQLKESKLVYNYCNYIIRQLYFKNYTKQKYNLDFVNEFEELKGLFNIYILENKPFTSLFSLIICKYGKIKNYSSNKINLLYFKRYEQIRNEVGLYLNKFIKNLKSYNIKKIIVGYNKGWKQEINLGKKNNQSFVNIPFRTILDILNYKLEDNNISYCEQEESYTSKASFIDNDFIPVYNSKENKEYTFSGKRIKRGLYKTLNNILIHSDLNGSLNIMKKAKIRILEELSYLKNKYIFPLNLFNFI